MGCELLMKKRISMLMILAVIVLTACEAPTMMYEGQELPVTTVEEIIADKLEVENPEMDIEVNVYEEDE